MLLRPKENEFKAIAIGPDRVRFSDCCDRPILNNRCPKCGAWLEDGAGKREIKIKGLDGKTSHRSPDILLSIIDDRPKANDPMPRSFRELERHGTKILTWSDSSIS